MKRILAAGSLVWAIRAALLGDRTRGGFDSPPWVVSVESSGFEMVSSMDRTGVVGSLGRALVDGLEVTTPGVLESSAEGSEATRERPLTPLTVGNHVFEAALLRGLVERCRGACADVGGEVESPGGVMWV